MRILKEVFNKLVTKNLIEDWENVLNLFPLGE